MEWEWGRSCFREKENFTDGERKYFFLPLKIVIFRVQCKLWRDPTTLELYATILEPLQRNGGFCLDDEEAGADDSISSHSESPGTEPAKAMQLWREPRLHAAVLGPVSPGSFHQVQAPPRPTEGRSDTTRKRLVTVKTAGSKVQFILFSSVDILQEGLLSVQ